LPNLDRDREIVVYRVAQEALTNVVRHAEAQAATAELRLARSTDMVTLSVLDNGRGSIRALRVTASDCAECASAH
jgi:two-component system sensor histidine kinase UhpB